MAPPDELEPLRLTKRQVMMLIDEIIAELNENKRDNYKYIAESWVLRGLLGRMKESKFEWIWNRLIEKIDRVRFANTAVGDIALRELVMMRSKDDATKRIVSELDFSIKKVMSVKE